MTVLATTGLLLLLVLSFAAATPDPLSREGHWTPHASAWHRNRKLRTRHDDTHAIYHRHVQRAIDRYASMLDSGTSSLERRFNQVALQKAVSRLQRTQANPSAPANLLILDDADNPNPQGEGFSPIGLEIALVQPVIKAEQPVHPFSVGLDIQANDIGYIATVQIGSPPRNFSLFVDSGSSDLWVGAESCKGYDVGDCGTRNFLGNTSTTFNDTSDPWHIRYGSGFVVGSIVTDVIDIAGIQPSNHHRFGIATQMSPEFASWVSPAPNKRMTNSMYLNRNRTPYDGFLGTAKSSLSQQRTPTLVEALRNQGLIKEGIVSYHIPRALDTMKAGATTKNYGELTFGSMNPAKYNASTVVTVQNLSPTGFWEAPLADVRINGLSIRLPQRSAILDTGSTLLVAPKADVAAIHKLIPGSLYTGSRWIIPCTTNTTISLVISGEDFPIDTRDLLFLPLSMGSLKGYCWSSIAELPPASKPKGTGVTKAGSKTTSWLVGSVFLKNVYFSTNLDRDTISIARLANFSEAETSPPAPTTTATPP